MSTEVAKNLKTKEQAAAETARQAKAARDKFLQGGKEQERASPSDGLLRHGKRLVSLCSRICMCVFVVEVGIANLKQALGVAGVREACIVQGGLLSIPGPCLALQCPLNTGGRKDTQNDGFGQSHVLPPHPLSYPSTPDSTASNGSSGPIAFAHRLRTPLLANLSAAAAAAVVVCVLLFSCPRLRRAVSASTQRRVSTAEATVAGAEQRLAEVRVVVLACDRRGRGRGWGWWL